jgi:hypothetical protein
MNAPQSPTQTELFLLRVWVEELGDGRTEVRGHVKHVLTEESAFFREWSSLLAFIQRKLAKDTTEKTP